MFKLIAKKYTDMRYRRGYEIASGVMLFNPEEEGLDLVLKILNETEKYRSYHRGMYDAMIAFKSKCEY